MSKNENVLFKHKSAVVQTNGKLINVTGYYQDIMDFVQDRKCTTGINADRVKEFLTKKDDGFVGGALEDVTSNDRFLKEFNESRQKLGLDELFETVRSKLGRSRARKRVNDENDGDYDYGKRWDIKPYSRGVVASQPTRIIDVYVDFSISAGTKQQEINKYACMAWILIDIIESFGVSCNLYMVNQICHATSGDDYDMEAIIQLKSSSEYFSPLAISRAMNSVFFRRIVFGLITQSADLTENNVSFGLGTPKNMGNADARFENGAVKLSCSGIFGPEQVEKIVQQIFAVTNEMSA